MASLLGWLGRTAKGIERQVNPFDAGLSYKQQVAAPEQRQKSVLQQAGQVGTGIVRAPVQAANTVRAGIHGVQGLAGVGAQSIFGSDQSYLQSLAKLNARMNVELGPTSGLLGQGTFFKNRQEAQNLTPQQLAGKSIGYGTQLASLVAPELKVAGLSKLASRPLGNALIGGAGSAAGQYVESGKINPTSALRDAATAAALGEALPLAKAAVSTPKQFKGTPLTEARLQDRNNKVVSYNRALDSGKPEIAERIGQQIDAIDNSTKSPVAQAIDKKIPKVSADYNPNAPKVPEGVPVTKTPRGFQGNIKKALPDNVNAQVVAESISGYKPIKNKNTLAKAANAIADNPQAEYARVVTKPQLTSANDVATGNLLLRDAIEKGDIESAIQLGNKLGVDGTELGRAIQAYSTFKKTTPEGIVTYASKQAGKAGRDLDPMIARGLIDKAKKIADMPEGLEKAKAIRELTGQAEKQGRTWKNAVGEILSTPRAALATADFSAPLRQGAVLGSRFPKQFGKAMYESVKYFFKPGAYEKAMYDLTQRPTYSLMKSRKLAVQAAEELTGTEEQFLSNILESKFAKKAGVGHVVAASNRAYTGFLTKLRADVFDKILVDSKAAGVKLGNNELDSLAKFVNSASGRGDGKITSLVSKAQVLFSPKLWKSRIDTLNPGYYAKLDPTARKYALQSAASFASIATTVIGLAAAAGADVENDPRSADFGKIKVGNTRYDILGGHQQNIRLAAQLLTGEKINSETGEIQTLGPDRGFGKPSRLDILYQFVENKENPVVGFASKALRGTDPTGKPINKATEFGNLFVPLTAQSTYETAKDQGSLPKGVAMNIPGTFGVGVQTYGSKPSSTGKVSAATLDEAKTNLTPTQLEAQAKEEKKALEARSTTEGYSLQQLSNGKYAYTLDGETDVQTTASLREAREAIAKAGFKNEESSYKIIGNKVYRKNLDGEVSTITKDSFDYQLGGATLTSQKRSGNLEGWRKTAESQLDLIDKQLKDPNIDPLEAIKLQNQAESLVEQMEKYQEYGGFTKPKTGRKTSASSILASSFKGGSTKAPSIPGIRVSVPRANFKAPKTRKLAVSKIPSSATRRKLA